jgi:hypothetical protein
MTRRKSHRSRGDTPILRCVIPWAFAVVLFAAIPAQFRAAERDICHETDGGHIE